MTVSRWLLFGSWLVVSAWAQSGADQKPETGRQAVQAQHHARGPAGEIGSGAGAIGTGAARGAGNLGKGTAKGAANLVTGHPVNATASFGKDTGTAGKDLTVGAVKGTAWITKGVAKGFKKLF
jgi:hypothetical protein